MSRKRQPPEAGQEPDFPQSPREEGATLSDVSAKAESPGKRGGEGTDGFPPGKEQRPQTSVHRETCASGLSSPDAHGHCTLQWTPGNRGRRFLCRLLSKPHCLPLGSQEPRMAGVGTSACPVHRDSMTGDRYGTSPACPARKAMARTPSLESVSATCVHL